MIVFWGFRGLGSRGLGVKVRALTPNALTSSASPLHTWPGAGD